MLSGLAVVLLALAGCTSSEPAPVEITSESSAGSPSPSPTASTGAATSDSPSPASPTPAPPTPLSGQELAGLLVDGLNLVLSAPQEVEARPAVRQQWNALTVPDSDAAKYFDEVVAAWWSDFVMRGDAVGEAMAEPVVDGDTATATICVSVAAQRVGAPSDDPLANATSDANHVPYEVTAKWVDQWLLAEVTPPQTVEGALTAQDYCVPPTITQAVTANWEGYMAAYDQAVAEGGSPEAIAEAVKWLSEPLATTVADSLSSEREQGAAGEAQNLLIHRADRDSAVGSWCRPGGEGLPIPTAWEGRWVVADGNWLLADSSLALDASEATGEFPEEAQRCF